VGGGVVGGGVVVVVVGVGVVVVVVVVVVGVTVSVTVVVIVAVTVVVTVIVCVAVTVVVTVTVGLDGAAPANTEGLSSAKIMKTEMGANASSHFFILASPKPLLNRRSTTELFRIIGGDQALQLFTRWGALHGFVPDSSRSGSRCQL
jgi:hypothetical protein